MFWTHLSSSEEGSQPQNLTLLLFPQLLPALLRVSSTFCSYSIIPAKCFKVFVLWTQWQFWSWYCYLPPHVLINLSVSVAILSHLFPVYFKWNIFLFILSLKCSSYPEENPTYSSLYCYSKGVETTIIFKILYHRETFSLINDRKKGRGILNECMGLV